MRTYVFVDLETSGLDPQLDRIVEIAWTYADEKLRRLMDTSHTPVQPVGAALDRINSTPEVLDMHTRTGLLDELKKPDLPLLQSVETVICEELDAINERYQRYLTTLTPEQRIDPAMTPKMEFVLAGKNVHFDKGFIDRYMPRLSSRLSHRVFDQTSLRYLLEALGISVNLVPAGDVAGGLVEHRAAFDVELSYTAMRFTTERLRALITSTENHLDDEYAEAFLVNGENGEFEQLDLDAEFDRDLRAMNGEE